MTVRAQGGEHLRGFLKSAPCRFLIAARQCELAERSLQVQVRGKYGRHRQTFLERKKSVGITRRREFVELDQEIDVAGRGIKIRPHSRTKDLQPSCAGSPTQLGDLVEVLFNHIGHGAKLGERQRLCQCEWSFRQRVERG